MKTFLLLIALCLAGNTFALCPGGTDNACSGHGSCGQDDKCTCYSNWQGVSCADRTCAYAPAWADVNAESNRQLGGGIRDEHTYMECAGKGICDRATGFCQCFPGFEGKGCARMECPNNCNGHGTCQYLDDVNSNYADWDAHRIQTCVCDPGYEGHDCSSRKCKPGDDPLTVASTSDTSEIQTHDFSSASGGEFVLGYTDWRGETWKTWALPYDTTALFVQQALRALPNSAMEGVQVVKSDANTFVYTFVGEHLSGDQPLLTVYTSGCATDGCQPYYTALTGTESLSTTTTVDAAVEFAVCSNRGKCNPTTGLCECFSGYHGESCNGQTVIR